MDELTQKHVRAQAAIRRRALAELMVLWQLFDPERPATWRLIEAGVADMVRRHQLKSATEAMAFFEAWASTHNLPHSPDGRTEWFERAAVVGSLGATGGRAVSVSLREHPGAFGLAKRRGLAAASGMVTRTVLGGGRKTLNAATASHRGVGSRRVLSARPCELCTWLARNNSRWFHDGCSCSVEPVLV